jgi:hypothetical protein
LTEKSSRYTLGKGQDRATSPNSPRNDLICTGDELLICLSITREIESGEAVAFRLSGARNVIVIDNRLYDVAVIGGGIRIENYSKVVHRSE